MYKIKQSEEDFKVEEVIDLTVKDRGDFVYFWLNKRGYSTVPIISRICDFAHVKPGRVGFAGSKDKTAVTKQAISIRDPLKRINKDTFNNFNSDRIQLEYIGRGTEHIGLGDLDGNRFDIVVESDRSPDEVDWFVNYFDDQRFSINNHIVGKAIIKKDWKTAAEKVISEQVKGHLSNRPNDFVGAFRRLPLKIRLMYVHAFQSLIWNECVKEYLKENFSDFKTRRYTVGELIFPSVSSSDIDLKKRFPIIGFGTEYHDPQVRDICKRVLDRNGVSERDYIVPSMPELSCDGGSRPVFVKVSDFGLEKLDKEKYRLKFFLPSGSYATMFIKRLFGK